MTSSKELHGTPTPSILLIGDGGTEKTRFAAQTPKPHILDFDAGLASTRDLPEFDYQTFKDVPFGQKSHNKAKGLYPWGEAWPAWINHLNEALWPTIESGERKLPNGYKFDTLVVDSLTTLTAQCMNYVLRAAGKKPTDPITLPEWGTQLRLMETVMDQLTAWPIRLIVTAHIKRDTNETMATVEYLPMITGQLAGRIGIYFDEVYYTDVTGKGDTRALRLITESTGLHKQAKSRHNVPNHSPVNWKSLEKYFKAVA
jgi:hypothetical protein